jgi:ligand-binding sensor domain-containing protein/serine phosphatase RsbU (regulator of sigma subunit)
MKRLFFIPLVILWFQGILWGQVLISETKLFTANEGLSQLHINALLQDSRGFIWICTEDGLDRFDGYEFVTYNHQPFDTNSLSNNYVNAICEDQNGILWIATDKGLNSFSVTNNLFTNYLHDETKFGSISDDVILNVQTDSKGTLWVKTLQSLDQFDSKTKTFRQYSHHYDALKFSAGNISYPIFEDKQKHLWIGTRDGLNYFDRDLQLFYRYASEENNLKSLSNDDVRAICEDKDGILWIGTANGLNAFNPISQEFNRYYAEPNAQIILHNNEINALYLDKSGLLWVGTRGGLYLFDKLNGKFNKVVSNRNDVFNNPIHSILHDKSGSVWVGTLKGLIRISPQKAKFKLIRSGENSGYSLASNDISSLFIQDNNNLWIGTRDNGLSHFNLTTKALQRFDFNKQGISENNYIHHIFEFRKDEFWLGTDNGILVFSPLTGNFEDFCKVNNFPGCESLIQKRVNAIIKDTKNRIWAGSIHGLYKIDPAKQQMKIYLNDSKEKTSLCNNVIYCLAADNMGNIWVGTENGLDYLNCETDKFTHYTDNPKSMPPLSSRTIYSLMDDEEGSLWIGTSSGLDRLNTTTNSIKIITEKDGLSDNTVCAILSDNKKNIWVSTNHGLSRIDPNNYQIRTFDIHDGLQDYEFNRNAACKSPNGELFFGGVAGINAFAPDSLAINRYVPPIVITSIELISANGNIKPLSPFSSIIVIPYKARSFNVKFAALDFNIPEKNNFAYKFYSGQEDEWVNIGNRHWISFSNLKPGEYTLKIIGSNNDLVWNDKGISVIIRIESPFWLKTEAYYVYGLLLGIFILGLYRYRTFHLRQANKILKEREGVTVQVERQKEQLALKNKNITDSINYAKRIQEALMPSEKSFKKILPQSFVYHQPKDIVSGDFFWVSERGNKIYVAAVDCTGHGVPGAFMSIIGFELFRNITHSRGVDDPSQILNILNQEFESIFRDVENFTFKDGMDIAFCVIDKSTRILEFSGAVNPIYLIRDNKITEIRGSRFSVGLDDNYDDDEEQQTFENKQIILQEDDMIYLFSDGYADQFGGEEGKKFKYRRFRHLLLYIHQNKMEDQKRSLEERINHWKGDLEQVDDILVIGFRPVFNNG